MTCDVIKVTTRVGSGRKRLYETGGRMEGSSRRGDKEEEGGEGDDEGRAATLTSPQGSGGGAGAFTDNQASGNYDNQRAGRAQSTQQTHKLTGNKQIRSVQMLNPKLRPKSAPSCSKRPAVLLPEKNELQTRADELKTLKTGSMKKTRNHSLCRHALV
ncbi:hypothetical protein Q5P01_021869 [Channa striata]|uniref:Uncharacterized protein n=1 Tax=Channa striata TaxID=64152 RepID=A0AA88S9T7_CHASR|nr:hypothetical protein Q5P01_021869 [Channa striata]